MADEKDKPSPTARHRDPSCNLPHCDETDDLTRGLCPVHWSTHRGLADPLSVPEGASGEGTLP